jgi:geranylgeranyl reductase family protein
LERYDVIVVGAGPAGATTARHCALNNLRTLLIEKEKIPRYKPCAGAVTRGAAKELGFSLPKSLIERTCNGIRYSYGKFKNQIKSAHPLVYMVKRSSFDSFLVEKAAEDGAEVHDSQACISLFTDGSGVRVKAEKGEYQANIVVGADGFHSRVLRSLRSGFQRDEIRFCVSLDIPIEETRLNQMLGDMLEIHFMNTTAGYIWLFPKAGYVSAGFGSLPVRSRLAIQEFRRFLKNQGFGEDLKLRGCFLPVSRFRTSIHGNRILLAGDAAGFVNAVSGEGIRFAVSSGKIAAQVALHCHEQGDFSREALKEYQDRCTRMFGRDLLRAVRLSDLMYSYPGLFFGTAIVNEEIVAHYLMTVTGEKSFCGFTEWVKYRLPIFVLKRIFSRIHST